MSSELMRELAAWKLEAKLEDTARYFYHTRDVERIDSGDICYVIGRKGTGKTAIGEFLHRRTTPKHFAEKLTFKNFPFNDLYRLSNDRYTPPNQYITLWKWIIYCFIAKMMMRNENIDVTLRAKLSKIFPTEPISSLSRSITHLTSPELRVSFMGLEVLAAARRVEQTNELAWIERCNILEEVINKYVDDSSYTLIFDELDEDYKEALRPEAQQPYLDLLTGLFKAVQDIKATFPSTTYGLRPIIFLRNDIYDLIRDPDKTKWNDLRLELRWGLDEIRNLLGFRIARAVDANSAMLQYAQVFPLAFKGYESMRALRRRPLIEWIGTQTLSRPRDYISFLKIAADRAVQRNAPFIDGTSLLQAITPYSEYLRSDLQDEMQTVLPEIHDILNILARLGTPIFTTQKFNDFYEQAANENSKLGRDPKEVLHILFRFGVVGNRTPVGRTVSGAHSTGLEFNPSLRITVLRGLLQALQIQDPDGQSFSGLIH